MEYHEYLRAEDHYESRSVGKGRTDKRCAHCGRSIPKGTLHQVHTFYPEFSSYPVHNSCSAAFEVSLIPEVKAEDKTLLDEREKDWVNVQLENDNLVLELAQVLKDSPTAPILQGITFLKQAVPGQSLVTYRALVYGVINVHKAALAAIN